MTVKKLDHLTIKEYLEYELASSEKHEFENGKIYAMSGGTFNHGVICGNIYSALKDAIRASGARCITLGSEVRVHIEKTNSIVYPDTMVVCGKVDFSEQDENAVINPTLVVEVLSKSTSGYDHGEKFYKYRHLTSFREYILIHQDQAVIESFYLNNDGHWKISNTRSIEDQLIIDSIDIKIPLSEIYSDVIWE
jgi:Uma2 family endonuclease